MGDLIHEPRNASRKNFKKNSFVDLLNKLETFISMRVMLNMLSNFKNIGFCANHYKTLIENKISNTNYFRVPLIKPDKIIEYQSKNNKSIQFLLIGDLTGTVTTSSLIYLKKNF